MTSEWKKESDPRTGREVWQLTQGDADSHFCYQTVQGFTADERWLVFASKRTGRWQLYRSDLRTGEVERLTDEADLRNQSYAMHPNGREVFFFAGSAVGSAEVATRRVRRVMDLEGRVPAPPSGHEMAFSADGRRAVIGCGGKGKTHSHVCLADLETGEVKSALDWPNGWLCHFQICPANRDWVTFDPLPDPQNDMSKSLEERARAWLLDVGTGRARPLLMCPTGTRGTHEYWGPSGRRMYFHHKTQPGWVPTSLASIGADGGDWRTHYTSATLKLGHSAITGDERWIVADVQEPGENPLLLVEAATGRSRTVCWPNSSSRTGVGSAVSHVHPSFSPLGTYVGFTSDRTGRPQVCVAPVGDLVG